MLPSEHTAPGRGVCRAALAAPLATPFLPASPSNEVLPLLIFSKVVLLCSLFLLKKKKEKELLVGIKSRIDLASVRSHLQFSWHLSNVKMSARKIYIRFGGGFVRFTRFAEPQWHPCRRVSWGRMGRTVSRPLTQLGPTSSSWRPAGGRLTSSSLSIIR